MQSPSRLPQLLRGTGAAAIATFAALFAHVIGGGAIPGPLGIAVPLLLSLVVCVLLAGRAPSLWRLSASVTASQTLFHALFVLGTPVAAGARTTLPSMPHHHHSGAQLTAVPEAAASAAARSVARASEHTLALLHGDLTMWVSHLVAAVVTILFLARGEQAIHRLRTLAERFAGWLGSQVPAPLHLTVVPRSTAVRAVEASGWSILSQLQGSSLQRRGPPFTVRIS